MVIPGALVGLILIVAVLWLLGWLTARVPRDAEGRGSGDDPDAGDRPEPEPRDRPDDVAKDG